MTLYELRLWAKLRTEVRPDVLGGRLVFLGTRLSVAVIAGRVRAGNTVSGILKDYPYLTANDVRCARLYNEIRPRR